MSNDDRRAPLLELQAELEALAMQAGLTTDSPQFVSWRSRTRSALMRALGADHHITRGWAAINWVSMYVTDAEMFVAGANRTRGYLDAALHEVEVLASTEGAIDASGVDPELWEHVAAHILNQAWGTVASQTAIFTEDRIRQWTGQPAELVGEKLMTAVLGDGGGYRLGLTAGEKSGWHRLGMGVSMALRNADAHRIQTRPDHRLYAMGVVGASSLLLTQLRYEHGNRFHDTAPVPVQPAADDGEPA